MEDKLPKKWKTTSKKNGRRPNKKWKVTYKKGRQPKKKWKTTSKKMEDNLSSSSENYVVDTFDKWAMAYTKMVHYWHFNLGL